MTSTPATATPRFLVVGPGAIGGTLAVQLHRTGHAVEVVARGAHLEAIRGGGLELVAPDGRWTAPVVAHARVAEAAITADTVVVLTTKAHQVEPVLDALLAHAGPDVEVACAHNGVEGERLALRRFRHVHGVLINVPGIHLVPGRIEVYAAAPRGVLDIGRYPSGRDATTTAIATAFAQAQFLSEACHDVMARKWAKLLGNVGNGLQVLCGLDADIDPLYRVLRAEAEQVATAAGARVDLDTQAQRATLVARAPIDGVARRGGSTWQSAVRATGGVEVTMLNGEICLLGRLHGVPTPANELVQTEVLALVAGGGPLGTRTVEELLERVARRAGR